MEEIEKRLETVKNRIAEAASRAGRDPSDVTLVAVSKEAPISAIRRAMQAGQLDFGENRVDELAAKAAEAGGTAPPEGGKGGVTSEGIESGPLPRWHFVGRLQTNKARKLLANVSLLHSLDRGALADELQKRRESPLEVLVQVNVTGELTKAGIEPGELVDFVASLQGMSKLEVAGLMTMTGATRDPERSRPHFRRLGELRESLAQSFPRLHIRHLSMGMSQDYAVAVEEGSTIVRVGTAIFGPRTSAMGVRSPAGLDRQ